MQKRDWRKEGVKVLESLSASFWIKDALRSALKRDCLDAARDAELLALILKWRCEEEINPYENPFDVREATSERP